MRGLTHCQGTGLGQPQLTQDPCALPGEPYKHYPLLGDTVHLPTPKWVGVLGLVPAMLEGSVPRGSR